MDYEQRTFKLSTKFFDNRKTQIILGMENGSTYIVVWLKLLALAGQGDFHGSLYVTKDVPYTPDELSSVLRVPVDDIVKALYIFKKYSMILITDDGIITIKNWDKYQNPEEDECDDEEEYDAEPMEDEETTIDRKRELTRKRVAAYRAKKRDCNADVTQCNAECNADVTQESVTCHADETQQGSLPPTPPNSPKKYIYNNIYNNISPFQENEEGDNEEENKGFGEKEKEPKRKVFVKPTEEEVDAYCAERKNGIKGAAFIDYYDSVGWVVGTSKKPMKDWKAAVRQWERKNDESVVNSNQVNRGNHTRDSCQPRTAYDLKPRFAGHKYDADGNDITGQQPD